VGVMVLLLQPHGSLQPLLLLSLRLHLHLLHGVPLNHTRCHTRCAWN
jgi:hypothetical protein